MAKTDLTDEEKKTVIEALNSNTEPPPELMTKLFPVWPINSMWPNWTGPRFLPLNTRGEGIEGEIRGQIIEAIKQLMEPPKKPRKKIGF